MPFRCFYRLFLTVGVAAVASSVNAQSGLGHAKHAVPEAAVEDLQPFTHTAFIPVGADLSSFRLQNVKTVLIPTRKISRVDKSYCAQLIFRDPGGSMYCASEQFGGFTRAYQVTYSFDSPPIPSDEYGNRRFTFSVYFRPEELSMVQQAGRAHAREFFTLTTSRMPEQRWMIDEDHSAFCDGNYVEGSWVHTNPNCEDEINLKKIGVLSDYVAVTVEPAKPRVLTADLAK